MNRKGLKIPKAGRSRPALDVAIVGMACRFPGASNLTEFWENIQNAVDATSDVAADRWDAEEFHQPGQRTSDRVDTRSGG
ncbi:MAG TPA: beta-ketoacyl synthase N-terminal-like domain-containing protein, partial [Isosphaeraceae bacterium]|nr:beta-ketoacyl synthase N-terminal-like domain-containing protein [Isosphaeraceae bacterium]